MRLSKDDLAELEPFERCSETHQIDGTGDPISTKPLNGNIRFCTINVNGIRNRGKNDEDRATAVQIHTEIILDQAKTNSIDFLTITEPNIDLGQMKIREAVYKGSKIIDRFSKVSFATSVARAEKAYKPGGVLTFGFNGISGKIMKQDYDRSGLGRWTTMTIQGNADKCLTVISVYVPISNPINSQTSVAAQQAAILAAKGSSADPTTQTWNDLNQLIESYRDEEHEMIILGDMNASIFDDGKFDRVLAELCINHDLTDAIDERFPQTAAAPSWKQGRRIDYILCSPTIAEGITKAGISEIGTPFVSDHRAVFCDLDFNSIFGSSPLRISKDGDRIINPRNISQVGRFLLEMDKRMTAQRIHERCSTALDILSSDGPFDVACKIAREADIDLRNAMLESERRSGQPYKAPWSKTLHRATRTYSFWTFVRAKYISPIPTKILTFARTISIEIDPYISMTEVKKKRNESEEELLKIRKNAATERQMMLEDDLDKAVETGDKRKAKILRRVINAEATRESYLKLKRIQKKRASGLTAVQLINDDGTIKTTTDPTEMTDLLVTEGRRHYAQAEGTPFTTTPLADIEYTADCIRAKAILDGCSTFTKHKKLDEFERKWIEHAKRMNFEGIEKMSVHLSRDDVKKGYAAWNTSTTTSPAGDHLGIYAALNKDLSPHEDDLPKELASRWQQIQNKIWDSVTAIMNMGASFGLTLPRWQEAVCVLIEKAPGNFLLHKLRRIFILPSDLNLILRELVGRRLIYRAEAHDWIHKDLWGNRPNRSATDAIFMKEMMYTNARLTNTALATFDNDAKSCYDRIVIKVALILAQRIGLPEITARWIAQTAAKMKKWVQTGYGLSNKFWGHDDGSNVPQHGSVQGQTDSGAKWLIDSSYIAERMDVDAKGAYFCSPDQQLEHELRLIGFVDDVSQFLNFFREYLQGQTPTTHDIARVMQNDADTWRQHVRMTGGELELPKCFWYLFQPDVDRMNRPRATQKTALIAAKANIVISNEAGKVEIELKGPDDPHKTLGVHKSISGLSNEQYIVSKTKSEHLAHLIARADLNFRQTRMAHEAIVIPSLVYPLAASTLSWEEAKQIHAPALNACLSKLSLPRSIGRHQIHTYRDLGGLQLSSLAGMQAWTRIEVFQTSIRRNDESSKLTRIGLAWAQLIAGTEDPILAEPDQRLLHLPLTIFTAIRDSLSSHRAKLEIHNAPSYPTLRHQDAHIMELARRWTSSRTELTDINLCRLYLGVITIADMATPDGRRLEKTAYLCSERNFRRSRLVWPHVEPPSKEQHEQWRRFIVRTILKLPPNYKEDGNEVSGRHDRQDMQLASDLGKWTHPPLSRQRFDEMSGPLGILKWSDGKHVIGTTSFEVDEVPHEYVPYADYDGRKTNRFDLPAVDRRPYTPAMDRYRPHQTPNDEPWNWSKKRSEIIDTIQNEKTLIVATDGSRDSTFGGYGIVIAAEDGSRIADTWDSASGSAPTSFRTEAEAIYHAAKLLTSCADEVRCNFRIVSDSQSLVKLIKKTMNFSSPSLKRNQDEYDLLWPTIKLLWTIRSRISMEWIRSHQDRTHKPNLLTPLARLNIHVDHLANKGTNAKSPKIVTTSELNPIQLYINDEPCTRRQRRAILQQTYVSKRYKALRESLTLSPSTMKKINWKALGASISSLSHDQQITASRIVSDNLPLGDRLIRSCKFEDPTCASCGNGTHETIAHMICCDRHQEWRKETTRRIRRLADTDAWPQTILNMIYRRLFQPLTQPPPDDLWPWLKGIHLWRGLTPTDLFANNHVASAHPDTDEHAGKHLVSFLFERIISLWMSRNGIRHGTTPEERQAKTMDKLRKRATLLASSGIQTTRHLVVPDADKIKELQKSQLRAFIRWADVLLALQERPPPEPDPKVFANANFYCPRHSRTVAPGANKRRLDETA